jgi:dolichol kinase
MSFPWREILGATTLLILFLSVIGVVETLMRKGRLAAETARKSIHVAGGLGCLLFPLLISSWISVLCLAVVFASILYLGENRKMLQSLSMVERRSCGSLLFPVAILMLFILSEGRIWLYVSSLLVLVLADTAAALAGTRFGRTFYETAPGESKSLEGTLMFCVVGFFSVYLSMVALSDIPHLTCILTALLMALLLGGLEAVSIGGTDNLLVPLGTCFLLLKLPTKPQAEILFQCLSFIGISMGIAIANSRQSTLRTRPLIIFILSSFAAWSLGSADWMIPIIVGFIVYNHICSSCDRLPAHLAARVLLRPMYPPLFILFAANATLEFDFWFAPYVVATATTTSLCVASRYRRGSNCQPLKGPRKLAAILLPITLSLLLSLPIQGKAIWATLPFALPLCAITALVYMRYKHSTISGFPWSYAITFYSGAAALIYAGFQRFGFVQPLEPSTWMEVFR